MQRAELPNVIGWSEYVALPQWGIRALRAKADTGARSSALHVEAIEELPRGRVRFDVVLHRLRRRRVTVEARIARRGRVRSSNGHYATRIFVRTRVRIGPIERRVELSLVDRGSMLYRMLLGRRALDGLFVDPHRKNLVGKRPLRRRKST